MTDKKTAEIVTLYAKEKMSWEDQWAALIVSGKQILPFVKTSVVTDRTLPLHELGFVYKYEEDRPTLPTESWLLDLSEKLTTFKGANKEKNPVKSATLRIFGDEKFGLPTKDTNLVYLIEINNNVAGSGVFTNFSEGAYRTNIQFIALRVIALAAEYGLLQLDSENATKE